MKFMGDIGDGTHDLFRFKINSIGKFADECLVHLHCHETEESKAVTRPAVVLMAATAILTSQELLL